MVTLVGFKVTSLSACMQTISKAALIKVPEDLLEAVTWKLRRHLAAVAAGDPGFPSSACPPFNTNTVFNFHPAAVEATTYVNNHVRAAPLPPQSASMHHVMCMVS